MSPFGLDPSIIDRRCDYCEFWEMCGNLNVLLTLIIVSTPEPVLDVVRCRLRHLMEPSARSSHVSVWWVED